MNLLSFLQQSWPELLLQLLLSQDQLDILSGVVDLALLGVNLSVELKFEMVASFEGIGVAVKGEGLVFDVELQVCRLNIWHSDGEIDEVLFSLSLVRSLGPEDYLRG